MKNVRMTICLVIAVLVMATSQGFGWTQYKDGLTHNISSTINDDVWVDYQSPGMLTTVNVLTGGNIPSPYSLQGYSDGKINISGGTIGYHLLAGGNSQVTLSSGTVSYLTANDNSKITMSGGTMAGFASNGSSQFTMSGGTVSSSVDAGGNSQLTVSGGTIGGKLYLFGSSQVTMSGGTVTGYLRSEQSGNVSWSGGTISQNIRFEGNGILTLIGTNFAIDGTPFSSGEITSILGSSYSNDPFRRLTGTLSNGDIINNQFQLGNTSKIVLVPEPATLLLLGLGGLLLSKRGR